MKKPFCLILLLVFLLFQTISLLGNGSYKDLLSIKVLSASFFEIDPKKAAGHISIFSQRFIEQNNIISLSDLIMNYMPGMYVGGHQTFGDIIGVRGLSVDSNGKTLMMRDSIHLNFRATSGRPDYNLPLMGDIEKVEIILGPGAILHGSGAINNFINVITPTGTSREGLWSKFGVGFSGWQRSIEVSYGSVIDKDNNFVVFFYAGYVQSEGIKAKKPFYDMTYIPSLPGGGYLHGIASDELYGHAVEKQFHDPNLRFTTRIRYGKKQQLFNFDFTGMIQQASIAPDTMLIPEYFFNDWKWLTSDKYIEQLSALYVFQMAGNGEGYVNSITMSLAPKIIFNFDEKNSIELTPSYVHLATSMKPQEWILDDLRKLAGEDWIRTNDYFVNNGLAEGPLNLGWAEHHVTVKLVYKTKMIKNNLFAAGLNWSYKRFGDKDISIFYKWKDYLFASPIMSWNEFNIFAEDIFLIGDITLTYGIRYNLAYFSEIGLFSDLYYETVDINNNTKNLSMRAAVAWKLSKNQNLKLSYQEGFRFPDASYYLSHTFMNEKYKSYVDPIPALVPEKSKNLEIKYMHELLNRKLKLETTAFLNYYEKTLSWVDWTIARGDDWTVIKTALPNEDYWSTIANADSTFYAAGFEIGVHTDNLIKNLKTYLSYSFTKPLDYSDKFLAAATPDNTSWLRYPNHMLKITAFYKAGLWSFSIAGLFHGGVQATGTASDNIVNNDTTGVNEQLRARISFNLDVSINLELNKNIKLSLIGKNVTFNNVERLTFESPAAGGLTSGQPVIYMTAKYIL